MVSSFFISHFIKHYTVTHFKNSHHYIGIQVYTFETIHLLYFFANITLRILTLRIVRIPFSSFTTYHFFTFYFLAQYKLLLISFDKKKRFLMQLLRIYSPTYAFCIKKQHDETKQKIPFVYKICEKSQIYAGKNQP